MPTITVWIKEDPKYRAHTRERRERQEGEKTSKSKTPKTKRKREERIKIKIKEEERKGGEKEVRSLKEYSNLHKYYSKSKVRAQADLL